MPFQSELSAKRTAIPTTLGGEIPLVGRFNQRGWAKHLGITERVFREAVQLYDIPRKKMGRDIFVDAEVFWNALPDG